MLIAVRQWIGLVAVATSLVSGVNGFGQSSPAVATRPPLRAGPVYTSGGQPAAKTPATLPTYPLFDVAVPLDPRWTASAFDPAGWRETEPGSTDTSPSTTSAISVRRFDQTGYGLSVVLALDVSGSMRGRTLEIVRTSVVKFVGDAKPQDRVAVMTFADEARWDVPFTAESAKVRQAIEAIAARGHETHLYDAMLEALDRFEEAMPQRRVLIVLSDGHDEGSSHTLEEVIAKANARRISIHTIGVTHSDPRYLATLQRVSEATGGNYSAARSDAELDQLLSNGIAGLEQTPVVRFKTARNDPAPATVPITITWTPQQIVAEAKLKTASQPHTFPSKRQKLLLSAGAIAVALCALLVFCLKRRRPAPQFAQVAALRPAPIVFDTALPHHDKPEDSALIQPPYTPPLQTTYGETTHPPSPSDTAPAVQPSRRQTRLAVPFAVAADKPLASLHAVEGPLAGTNIAVDRTPFTIGAARGNSLAIDGDPTLSGNHARLSLESSMLMLDDLGSTNGTYINGVALKGNRRSLAPGDELRVGRSRFRVAHPPRSG